MIKKYLLTGILFLTINIVFGQNLNLKYYMVVTYNTITSFSGYPKEYESKLYIGRNESCFILNGPQKENIGNIGKNITPNIKLKFGSKYPMFFLKKYNKNYYQFYTQSRLKATKYFIVNDTVPTIKWKLSKERKEIYGYMCNKATGAFRGRTYTVWFTNQIPLSLGPWKLGGLPGLIIKAVDSTGEVSFNLVSIKKKNGIYSLKLPQLKEISWLEYKKIIQKFFKRIYGYFRTMQDENVEVKVSKPTGFEPSIFDKRNRKNFNK